MFEKLICDEDVAWASKVMGLGQDGFSSVGEDDSRLRALLRLDTVDFEACPGSGKTTLLVAKLAVIAKRWTQRQRGVCVLSHTNAARNEIGAKLSSTAAGASLMRYPHFVGTIHSFVNEHLALPWLRSKGIEIRSVDNEIALAKRWALLPRNTRWALTQANLTRACMSYSQADFSGGETGRFGPLTPTHQAIVAARRASSEQGYFCFDEMFVWANEFIESHPDIILALRQRYPIVFIDEAQDNSEAQSVLLQRVFCGGDSPSRRQRFGDSNQAIYGNSAQSGALTDPFPSGAVHPMPRSYRFGQALADQVKGLGVVPQPLVGAGPPASVGVDPKPSVIFLFDDGSVNRVLARYGEYLLETFAQAVLDVGVFTAVAGVHELSSDDRLPRAMGHYAPNYNPSLARRESAPSRFSEYLAKARQEVERSGNSEALANATAAGLLAAGELAGMARKQAMRRFAHRGLVQTLDDDHVRSSYFGLLDIVLLHRGDIPVAAWVDEVKVHAEVVIKYLGGVDMIEEEVAEFMRPPLPNARAAEVNPEIECADNVFVYPSASPRVRIRLGSIHSVKGETHTATLVLDSYYHSHHLSELKPWLLGRKSGGSSMNRRGVQVLEGSRTLARLKLHYVAMTRPTHLLCIAMRRDCFDQAELNEMAGRGWTIIDC